jgi:hypothetical protein
MAALGKVVTKEVSVAKAERRPMTASGEKE